MRDHGTGLVRATAVVLLCGLAMLLGSGQAFAHTRLTGSDPADGASLASAPERVSLRFNESMQADFSQVSVTGPVGGAWEAGPVTSEGPTASVALRPLGPAGRYEIGYRVVSDDGHPVTGTVTFVLTGPGPGTVAAVAPAPSAAPSGEAVGAPLPAGDAGAPVWPWLLGVVVLIGGGVTAAMRLGRG